MNLCGPESFGADPVNVQWQVVRGDTATMRVEFLDDDGTTPFDVSNWTFSASSYDPKNDVIDELQVVAGVGYVDITAPTDITSLWGTGYRSVSAELTFDVQAVIDSSTTWTPVVGTIKVLSDVSGSTL